MREKKLGKIIKKALKEDHLYSNEELNYMKKELHNLQELVKQKKQQSSKGFGNYETN
jgi:hypothetical protein